MSLFIASRVPLRQAARRVGVQSRSVHSSEYKHLPFESKNKAAFAAKVVAYCGAGFGLPFFAAAYQINKASGTA